MRNLVAPGAKLTGASQNSGHVSLELGFDGAAGPHKEHCFQPGCDHIGPTLERHNGAVSTDGWQTMVETNANGRAVHNAKGGFQLLPCCESPSNGLKDG
jgi:hypothetical protein